MVRDAQDDRLLPHQIRRSRLTKEEKNPQKHWATEKEALQTKGAKFRAVAKIIKTRHVHFGIFPCVETTSLRPDANFGRTCFFSQVEADGQPRSGSSGATHVPDRTSTNPSPRTLPRCDSGLPRDTLNGTGITGNVYERPPAQEGQFSTLFDNSRNLASFSQDLRPDISETAKRYMKRESLNTPIQSPHFQSRSVFLDHTGGTNSFIVVMDYPRVLITEWNLRTFPDSMEFQSWLLDFRTDVCMRTAEPQVTMLWIKEVEVAKSSDVELILTMV